MIVNLYTSYEGEIDTDLNKKVENRDERDNSTCSAGCAGVNFDAVYKIMDESFPNSEMRTYEGQKKLLYKSNYRINTKVDENGEIIGFLAYWVFEDCIFLEHLAVSMKARGRGIGGQLIEEIIKNTSKKVFLEVEPPVDDASKKRVGFYQKRGIKLSEFSYEQPSLRPKESVQRLMIMSYPDNVSEEEFSKYKKEIFKDVYNIDI